MPCLRRPCIAALLLAAAAAASARADATPAITVIIRNHRFIPSEIDVPAGTDVLLDIRNEDAAAEEFDLAALSFREVVFGKQSGAVRLPDVEAGRYPFVGDYHSASAQGVLVVE